jgi:hypothetical protein
MQGPLYQIYMGDDGLWYNENGAAVLDPREQGVQSEGWILPASNVDASMSVAWLGWSGTGGIPSWVDPLGLASSIIKNPSTGMYDLFNDKGDYIGTSGLIKNSGLPENSMIRTGGITYPTVNGGLLGPAGTLSPWREDVGMPWPSMGAEATNYGGGAAIMNYGKPLKM